MPHFDSMRQLREQHAHVIDLSALPSGRISSSVHGGSLFQPRAVVILDAMIQGGDRFFIERDALPANRLLLTPRDKPETCAGCGEIWPCTAVRNRKMYPPTEQCFHGLK